MIHVAAPPRVRERLLVAADGPREIVHASASALYVDLDGWCLGLVSASASRVPCALWSSLPDVSHLGLAEVRIAAGALLVGPDEVRISRLADPRPAAVAPRPTEPSASLHPTLTSLGAVALPLDGRLTVDHAEHLLGRGPGLTPLGDDVLAGWLATRHAMGLPDTHLAAAVRRRLGVTTLLSATLLDCALHGEMIPQLADWLTNPTPTTTDALLAVGATSGAGLLTGADLALKSMACNDNRPGRAA